MPSHYTLDDIIINIHLFFLLLHFKDSSGQEPMNIFN